MEKSEIKKALEKSYSALQPFSDKYKADFKRFLFSLNFISSESDIKGKRILDIGSGIGIMAIALKNLGAEVSGVDKFIFPDEKENFYTVSNFGELKRIWDKHSFKVIKTDAEEKLPFEDGYFDIVVCDATIEHLKDSPLNLFGQAHRILKKEGLFLLTTPNLATLLKRTRFLFGRSPYWNIADFFESGGNFKGHRREFTPKEAVKMLEWSSFKVIKKATANIFFEPKRFLDRRKIIAQIYGVISRPFPSMRDMIYILAKKN